MSILLILVAPALLAEDSSSAEAQGNPVQSRVDDCNGYLRSLLEYNAIGSSKDIAAIDQLILKLKNLPMNLERLDVVVADEVIHFLTTTRFEDPASLEKLTGALGRMAYSRDGTDKDLFQLRERIYLDMKSWLLKRRRSAHEVDQVSYFLAELVGELASNESFLEEELTSLVSELPNSRALSLIRIWFQSVVWSKNQAGLDSKTIGRRLSVILDASLKAVFIEARELGIDKKVFQNELTSFLLKHKRIDEDHSKPEDINFRFELQILSEDQTFLDESSQEDIRIFQMNSNQLEERASQVNTFARAWVSLLQASVEGYSNSDLDDIEDLEVINRWVQLEHRWSKLDNLLDWVDRVADSLEYRHLSPHAKRFMLDSVADAFSLKVAQTVDELFHDSSEFVEVIKYFELKQVVIGRLMVHFEKLERALSHFETFKRVNLDLENSQKELVGDKPRSDIETEFLNKMMEGFNADEVRVEIDIEDPSKSVSSRAERLKGAEDILLEQVERSPLRRFAFLYDQNFPRFYKRYISLQVFELAGSDFSDLSERDLQKAKKNPGYFGELVDTEGFLSDRELERIIIPANSDLRSAHSADHSLLASRKLLSLSRYLEKVSKTLADRLYQEATTSFVAYRIVHQLGRLYVGRLRLLDLYESLIRFDLELESSMHQEIVQNLIEARKLLMDLRDGDDFALYSGAKSLESFNRRWVGLKNLHKTGVRFSEIPFESLEYLGLQDDLKMLAGIATLYEASFLDSGLE